MAFFGFKSKKEKEKTAEVMKPAPRAVANAASGETPARPETAKTVVAGKGIPGVLIAPHITEKATSGGAHDWYSFRVARGADKLTIKRAVEGRYGVRVSRVRVVNRRSRPIRLGRTQGSVPGFKNAMVKLQPGQTIEFS